MNRAARRKLERLQQSRQNTDVAAKAARIDEAQRECQRLAAMLQACDQAIRLASQIPVVPVEGEVSPENDPNFFRTAAIEDFTERMCLSRMKLIHAQEEFYLALEALDPAEAGRIQVAAPSLVTP